MTTKSTKKSGIVLPKLFMDKPGKLRASIREERSLKPNPLCQVCPTLQEENDELHSNLWRMKKYCRGLEDRIVHRSNTMDVGIQTSVSSNNPFRQQNKLKLWNQSIWDDDVGMKKVSSKNEAVNTSLDTYLQSEVRRLRSKMEERERHIADLERQIHAWKSSSTGQRTEELM